MAATIEIPSKANEPKRLNVAAYCRVSTAHEEQDTSLEAQIAHFEQLVSENPMWVPAGIFAEKSSGLSLNKRPEFRRMIRECEKCKIDLILTKSISRFGRNTLNMLKAVQTLREFDVDVYFEAENLWLHEKQIEFYLTALLAFAQSESEK